MDLFPLEDLWFSRMGNFKFYVLVSKLTLTKLSAILWPKKRTILWGISY